MRNFMKSKSPEPGLNQRHPVYKTGSVLYLIVLIGALVLSGATLCCPRAPVEQRIEQRFIAPVPVSTLIAREAAIQGIPAQLALDRAWAESRFRPDAVGYEPNGSTSYGVMQLNNRWYPNAAHLSVEENIERGVSFLVIQYRACGGNAACTHRAYRSGKVVRQ